ncbi:hypothetical protein ACFQ48_19300 [Hymenobacter caeli]|uniref:Uncharacterized protein n=1 Tax=Hymenobacter caeli TaxID=2735894 RepID=A0ABX2FXB9_9BACT|nr:hypothetical protein [Hymenobacter caeli]NRT21047.1 hypothetical protein [Hymenobacter caeli]
MSAEKLAFLQNFYTDVTLYVPVEPVSRPAPAAPEPPAPVAEAAPEAQIVVPALAPAPAPPPAAPPVPVPPARLPEAALAVPAAAPAVVPAAPAVPGPPAPPTPFTTQGSRADGVVLLVRLPPDQFVKLHRNVFLNKMLQALGLVMADVVLVNVESHLPVALAGLRRELAATQVVAFGRNLLDVAVRNTQIYEPVQFAAQGLSYLAAAEIEMVEYDVSLKKRLWPGLQRMFLG